MTARWPHALRRAVASTLEPLVAAPVVMVMRPLGLAGSAPLWAVLTPFVLFGVVQQEGVQRWLAGGDLRARTVPRLLLHLGVTTWVLYIVGWGPMLAPAFALVAAAHMRMSGARVWRPAAVIILACIALGQAGIATGRVHCYLPGAQAQAAGVLGAVAVTLFLRVFGESAELREAAEAALRSREERFRALVQDSCDAVLVAGADGRAQYATPAVQQLFGMPPERFVGTSYADLVHPDDIGIGEHLLRQALADPGGQHRAELRCRHPDGWRWLEVTIRNLLGNAAVAGLVVNCRDVTERRAIQERLAYDANHDALTGLANRSAFLRELDRCAADARRGGRIPAVLFVDLDGFKRVNDTFGHACGDQLIVAVAAVLRYNVRESDLVGRLGGDEFGVLVTGVQTADDAVAVAEKILAGMDQPVILAGQAVYPRASIGVAVPPPARVDAADLLHQADLAMYHAKRRATHGFQLYTESIDTTRDNESVAAP
ncbi:sensor domain-containing diguanylate cyclase [Dactylosporangium salmoneum]|uniref:PAS domain S-box-containing protein/diguanylate cyclase (GGDEF)-like protein n=1 Tax=Dactylosporangium salmoneum TaxID=53361 RepID=A0ABP5UU37_9ACTN